MSAWDEGFHFGDWQTDKPIPELQVPSAEDEYLASLDPEQDYTADLILALSTLTDKQRFAIECRFGFRGPPVTEREIALVMGINQQAVNGLISRGLEAMRRGLSNSPTDGEPMQKEARPQPGSLSG